MTAPMSPAERIRPIRVILADDDPNLRDALASLLGMDPRISIVGTAADGREVLALVEHRPADIVLMDVEMPVLDGVETTRIMSERHSSVRVVMFTAFEVQHRLSEALAAGACSFLTKDLPVVEIVDSLLHIHSGHRVLAPRAMDFALDTLRSVGEQQERTEGWARTVDSLSIGQRAVYEWLIQGATNREIAELTNYSEGTVRTYVTQLLDCFGCSSRTELAVRAARIGSTPGC